VSRNGPATIRNPAALPWYDFASTRAALDTVWRETRTLLATEGFSRTPRTLDHEATATALWAHPELTLSQCCGLDLFNPLTRNVVPFAAPVMTLDVTPGMYFSHIVARAAPDMRSPPIVAINDHCSHSGNTAVRAWLDGNGHQDYEVVVSGSHARSIKALQSGRADLAAIDALSWRYLDSMGVEIIGASSPAPAPPFITGRDCTIPPEVLVMTLDDAFRMHGHSLGITGVLPISNSEYGVIADQAIRYGVLAEVGG